MSVRRATGLVIVSVLSALIPGSVVRAYCRTTADPNGPTESSCPAVCDPNGNPLAWHTAKLSYGFNQRAFPGLTDQQLRDTFSASFKTWSDVLCDGESIGLEISQLAGTTTLEQGPMSAEPNENVIAHYDSASWAELGYASVAFALTAVWFRTSGEIVGADMAFNGGMDLYGDCAVNQCSDVAGGLKTDLQNVATHEIGHYLGLAHSDVLTATMSCKADAGDTDKRTLEADDVAGICAAYPPSTSFPLDHESHGCTLSAADPRFRFGLRVSLLLVALVLTGRRLFPRRRS